MKIYARDLVGRKVHIWQDPAITSTKHVYGTLARISGPAQGLPTLHLEDVRTVRGDHEIPSPAATIHWNLNWSIEAV